MVSCGELIVLIVLSCQMVGCAEAPVHCRCVQLTESSLCPLCGRSIRGLRTRQGSILTRSREVESDLLCYQVRILSLGCRQRSGGDPSQSDKQDDSEYLVE